MGSWARFIERINVILFMKVSMVCFEPWALEVAGSNPADPTKRVLYYDVILLDINS